MTIKNKPHIIPPFFGQGDDQLNQARQEVE